MFSEKCCKLLRFRYPKELEENKHSYLNSRNSTFSIKGLTKYVNKEISFTLINYDNEEKHESLELFANGNYDFKNFNGEVKGVIKSHEIILDFLEIKKGKRKSKPNSKHKLKNKTQKENCRIRVTITDYEKFSFVSNIIRDKGPGDYKELEIYSVGRPPSTSSWKKVILTLTYQVPYYPDEMKLVVGDLVIDSHTEDNEKLRYDKFSFNIPDAILETYTVLQCDLQCSAFQKSAHFSLDTGVLDKRKDKNEMQILKRTYPCSDESLTRISEADTNSSNEPVKKKQCLLVPEKNDCSLTPGTSCQLHEVKNDDFDAKPIEEDYSNHTNEDMPFMEFESQDNTDLKQVLKMAEMDPKFQYILTHELSVSPKSYSEEYDLNNLDYSHSFRSGDSPDDQ